MARSQMRPRSKRRLLSYAAFIDHVSRTHPFFQAIGGHNMELHNIVVLDRSFLETFTAPTTGMANACDQAASRGLQNSHICLLSPKPCIRRSYGLMVVGVEGQAQFVFSGYSPLRYMIQQELSWT